MKRIYIYMIRISVETAEEQDPLAPSNTFTPVFLWASTGVWECVGPEAMASSCFCQSISVVSDAWLTIICSLFFFLLHLGGLIHFHTSLSKKKNRRIELESEEKMLACLSFKGRPHACWNKSVCKNLQVNTLPPGILWISHQLSFFVFFFLFFALYVLFWQ